MSERIVNIAKAAVGACASIAIALAFGLAYAPSAGIITLLSLQETKKETLQTALYRLLIFAAALCFAWASFFLLGYSLLGLGLIFSYLAPCASGEGWKIPWPCSPS